MASGTYINVGNWLQGSSYVDINNGTATLCTWLP